MILFRFFFIRNIGQRLEKSNITKSSINVAENLFFLLHGNLSSSTQNNLHSHLLWSYQHWWHSGSLTQVEQPSGKNWCRMQWGAVCKKKSFYYADNNHRKLYNNLTNWTQHYKSYYNLTNRNPIRQTATQPQDLYSTKFTGRSSSHQKISIFLLFRTSF